MIKKKYLGGLRQFDFYQVVANSIAHIRKEDLEALGLVLIVTQLIKKFEVYDNSLVKARKSGNTVELLELDRERDQQIITLRKYIESCLHYPVEKARKAAGELKLIMEKYPAIQNLPLREETAAITNLTQDMFTTKQQANLETIHALPILKALNDLNTAFQEKYSDRIDETSVKETGAAKKARTDLEKVYNQFCYAVNGQIVLKGEADYKEMVDKINNEFAKAFTQEKQKVTARATRKAKENTEEGNNKK